MKNNIINFFVFCILTTGYAFSQEYQDDCEQSPDTIRCENYNYLKLGAGALRSGIGPAIGLGRRIALEEAAIDISLNWADSDKTHYFATPKMLYLHYLNPYSPSSIYLGGGLGLGMIKTKQYKFEGLLAEAAIGYEMHRNTSVRPFAEINLSHGTIPFKSKYRVQSISPAISFSVGAGF